MSHLRSFVAGTLLLTLFASSLALGQPASSIGPSPNAKLTLNQLQAPDRSDPVLSAVFAGTRSVLVPLSFYLTNHSSEPVIALAIVWTSTDQAGRGSTFRVVSDSFSSTRGMVPVISAGDRILVTPGGAWMPNAELTAYSQQGHFENLQMTANRFSKMSRVDARIDAVIMGSGEVDGPDAGDIAGDLTGRKKAALAVLAALDAAKSQGISAETALAPMLNPSAITGPLGAWEQRYSRSVLRVPGYADQHLRKLPEVPTLWKGTGGQAQ